MERNGALQGLVPRAPAPAYNALITRPQNRSHVAHKDYEEAESHANINNVNRTILPLVQS